jgi:hypothetical protein
MKLCMTTPLELLLDIIPRAFDAPRVRTVAPLRVPTPVRATAIVDGKREGRAILPSVPRARKRRARAHA